MTLEWDENSSLFFRTFHGGLWGKSYSALWSLAATLNTVRWARSAYKIKTVWDAAVKSAIKQVRKEFSLGFQSGITCALFLHRQSPHSGGDWCSLPWTGCMWDSVCWWAPGENAESTDTHLMLNKTASICTHNHLMGIETTVHQANWCVNCIIL